MNITSMGRFNISIIYIIAGILFYAHSTNAQESTPVNKPKEDQGYRIDKPGTITFTVGVKIKGKVEKPQVMIFLPREKPLYKDFAIAHSFYDDIMEPLPLKP